MWSISHFLFSETYIPNKMLCNRGLSHGQHVCIFKWHASTCNKNKDGVLPVTTPPDTGSLKKAAAQCASQSSTLREAVHRVMEQKVNIVARAQWGASAPKQKEKLKSSAQRVIIHHTALPSCKGQKECQDSVLSIQRGHMTERHFDDIGYNFLVGGDGTVFEGRGWGVVGAHTKGQNHDSVGIAFMGNFNNDTPSKGSFLAVKLLLQSGVSQGFLSKDFSLFGHRDLGTTECPGENLYAALKQLKSTCT